jgi:hypothetical protein
MNRIGNKWSEDEEQRMIRGLQQGKSLEQMARDHQRTPKAMEIRRDGLLRKLSSQVLPSELATMFAMPPSQIQDILSSTPMASTENPSKNIPKILEDLTTKIDRMETVLDKIYRRLKKEQNSK